MENTYGGVCEPINYDPTIGNHTDAEAINYTIRNEIRKTVMSTFAHFIQSPLDKMSIWNRCVRITEVNR